MLVPQIFARPILRRLYIGTTTLGAAAVLELGHLWIHAYWSLTGDPAPRIIIGPFRCDNLSWSAMLLNPVYQGQHGIMLGVGKARYRAWDRTFQGRLLIGTGEVPWGIVGSWTFLTVSYDVNVRREQVESAGLPDLQHPWYEEDARMVAHINAPGHKSSHDLVVEVQSASRWDAWIRKAMVQQQFPASFEERGQVVIIGCSITRVHILGNAKKIRTIVFLPVPI